MLETFIMNKFDNAYNTDLVNTMRVNDYYPNTGIGDGYILFKQIDLNDHVQVVVISCSDDTIINDVNDDNEYYFVW